MIMEERKSGIVEIHSKEANTGEALKTIGKWTESKIHPYKSEMPKQELD